MKAKIFEVILHKLRSGKSPATALEEQLNEFLAQHSDLRLVSSHEHPRHASRAERHAAVGGIVNRRFLHTFLHRLKDSKGTV